MLTLYCQFSITVMFSWHVFYTRTVACGEGHIFYVGNLGIILSTSKYNTCSTAERMFIPNDSADIPTHCTYHILISCQVHAHVNVFGALSSAIAGGSSTIPCLLYTRHTLPSIETAGIFMAPYLPASIFAYAKWVNPCNQSNRYLTNTVPYEDLWGQNIVPLQSFCATWMLITTLEDMKP